MKNRMIAVAGILCVAGAAFGQGSLTPPGAPGETMKTLQQVEPRIDLATVANYQITQSGSYYLSDNLVVSNSIGISIGASDVTLDLNGFKILHAGGQSGKAIYVSATRNITIKNGSIQEFEDGVYMYGSDGLYPTQGARLENLKISRCTGYGLFVGSESLILDCSFSEVRGAAAVFAAANSTVKNCTTKNSSGGHGFQLLSGARGFNCSAIDSGDTGFTAGSNSIFQACTASLNDGDGFNLLAGSSATGCTASKNEGDGFDLGEKNSIHDCVATANADYGIIVGEGALISGCNSSSNEKDGIKLDRGAVQKCVANSNDENGIYADSDSVISDCATATNGFNGIYVNTRNKISNCSSSCNIEDGVYARYYNSIVDCIFNNNGGTGIETHAYSLIKGNVCSDNHYAGIYITRWGASDWGRKNHITDNQMIQNQYGIKVMGVDNSITRNIAHSNSSLNYEMSVPGNNLATVQTNFVGAGPWDNLSF